MLDDITELRTFRPHCWRGDCQRPDGRWALCSRPAKTCRLRPALLGAIADAQISDVAASLAEGFLADAPAIAAAEQSRPPIP
jgi:hypothetical protein